MSITPPPSPKVWQPLRPDVWLALDCVVAVLLTVALYAALGASLRLAGAPSWLRLFLAAALSLPVAIRRRSHVLALGIPLGVSVIMTALGITAPIWPFLPIAVVLYLVAAACGLRVASAALAGTMALLTAMTLLAISRASASGMSSLIAVFMGLVAGLIVLTAWTAGFAVRKQRLYAAGLREQQARLVQAELDDARRAVTEERLRIARELHDVVAHSMSVIAVQAGVGHHLGGRQPAAAQAALAAIESTCRDALAEMRDLLGVLRKEAPEPAPAASGQPGQVRQTHPHSKAAESPEPPLLPAPGLADVDDLTAAVARAGVAVDLRVTGERRTLPAGVDLCSYRIVQEALTNVVKHARTHHSRVTLDYRPAEIFIEITNGCIDHGSTAPGVHDQAQGCTQIGRLGAGHGIVGMRERVDLYRGQFSAGPMPGGGFRVAAIIPVPGLR